MRKAFICPPKYVQGENEILNLGYFVKTFGESALLIAHPDDAERVREKLDATAKKFGISFAVGDFGGECSRGEVSKLQQAVKDKNCSCIVGLGGGKAIDTAKCVAQGDALIIVPTIASTDAPTSHSAVLYTDDGAFDGFVFLKQNPDVVLVDTTVIANAPVRFLVSGMGDALATYFEARASAASFSGVSAGRLCGSREKVCKSAKGMNAAYAMAELCYRVLLEDGVKAKVACECNQVTHALENIIEANILLSGLGFENGGLGAAHAIHNGFTILESTHGFFHGEKVAFGTLCQLVLENAPGDEINEVMEFCMAVGLPLSLADIGVDQITSEKITAVAEKACKREESMYAMPFPVTIDSVAAAIVTADRLGSAFKAGKK